MQNDNIDNWDENNPLLKTCPICNKYQVAYNAKICPGCGGNIEEYNRCSGSDVDNDGCIGCLIFIVWIALSCYIAESFNWDSGWIFALSAVIIWVVWFLIKKIKDKLTKHPNS